MKHCSANVRAHTEKKTTGLIRSQLHIDLFGYGRGTQFQWNHGCVRYNSLSYILGLVKDVEILHVSTTDIVHAKNGKSFIKILKRFRIKTPPCFTPI